MLTCPFCGEEIIEGVDACDACQQPLEFMSKPRPGSPIERSLVKGRVHQLAPHSPLVVESDTPVGNVLKLMVERAIGCVVVVDRGEVVGIFSERDALNRLNVDFAMLACRPVADFMTPSPEAVDSEARIAFALHKMDVGGYRHLPVLSGGKISGVISVRDILRYITDELAALDA